MSLTDTQRDFLTTHLGVKVDNPTEDTSGSASTWVNLHKTLAPQIEATLKANHPEASKIRAAWGYALEKADAGDHKSAIKAGDRLTKLLAATSTTDAQSEIPKDVVAFQKSRIMWIGAKRDMKSGLDKFRAAVMKQAQDDENKAEIDAATDALLADFEAFDDQLENHLDAITQTAEGPDRTRLKKAADASIQQYLKMLDGPFLSIVDTNPFISVNVAGRGRQCLSAIRATLA